jgi:hypothetical protein
MTAAELVRYNLARLIRESGRDPTDIALVAWPMPDLQPGQTWRHGEHRRTRVRRLGRYLSGKHKPSDLALEALARALECTIFEFHREPPN